MECWDRTGAALADTPAAVLPPLLGPSSWENGQAAPRVEVPRPKNLQGWAGTCQSKGGVRAGMSKRHNVASTSWMRQRGELHSAPPHRFARGKGRVPPWARSVGAADACPAGAHRHLLPLPETGQNRLGVPVLTPVTLPGGSHVRDRGAWFDGCGVGEGRSMTVSVPWRTGRYHRWNREVQGSGAVGDIHGMSRRGSGGEGQV